MSSDSGQTTAVRTIGRYRAYDELGRGAMGIVYRGFDPVIGRTVALKTLLLDSADAQAREFRERLYREAAAAGALSHPNIVTVFDIVEDGNVTAVAMEFIEGQSLASIIRDQGPLRLDLAVDYFAQICSALDFAGGAGIIHRDIKPANILVTPAGRVKITDFGVAKLALSTMTQAGTVLGSPSYMSPEQVRGLPLDARSDLFSAAVVFYEMITRERPFAGNDVATTMYRIAHEPPTPPSQFNAAIGPELTNLLDRALAKAPHDRFPTGAQIVEELRRVIGASTPSRPQAAAVLPATTAMPAMNGGQVPPRFGGELSATLPRIPTGASAPLLSPTLADVSLPGSGVRPIMPPLTASPARPSGLLSSRVLLGGAAAVVIAAVAVGVFLLNRPGPTLEEAPAAPIVSATPSVPAPPLETAATPGATESVAATNAAGPPSPAAPAGRGTKLPPPTPTRARTGGSGARPQAPVPTPATAPITPATASPSLPPVRGQTGRVYAATDVDERPRVLRQVAPTYPVDAARRGLEDVVVLKVLVAPDGRAEEVQVLRGSQKDPQFDGAAVAAVQLWQFAPARKAGQPVASWYSVGVPFQLKR